MSACGDFLGSLAAPNGLDLITEDVPALPGKAGLGVEFTADFKALLSSIQPGDTDVPTRRPPMRRCASGSLG